MFYNSDVLRFFVVFLLKIFFNLQTKAKTLSKNASTELEYTPKSFYESIMFS